MDPMQPDGMRPPPRDPTLEKPVLEMPARRRRAPGPLWIGGGFVVVAVVAVVVFHILTTATTVSTTLRAPSITAVSTPARAPARTRTYGPETTIPGCFGTCAVYRYTVQFSPGTTRATAGSVLTACDSRRIVERTDPLRLVHGSWQADVELRRRLRSVSPSSLPMCLLQTDHVERIIRTP